MTHGSKHKRLAGRQGRRILSGKSFQRKQRIREEWVRDTVTVQNVVLVKVIEDRNLMLVKGAVPGNKGGLVRIQYAVKGEDK